jgi:hypothetical protein
MLKYLMVSAMITALAVPALAGGVTVPNTNVPDNGTFGTDRAVWASGDTFGGAISARQGSNSTVNHEWMATNNGGAPGNSLDSNNPNLMVCGVRSCTNEKSVRVSRMAIPAD